MDHATRQRPSRALLLAPALVALAALGMACPARAAVDSHANAAAAQGLETDVARLEQAFWICDYLATTQDLQATPYATCRFVTEQLRKEKFGDDLDRLLDWWRVNKEAEHGKLRAQQSG